MGSYCIRLKSHTVNDIHKVDQFNPPTSISSHNPDVLQHKKGTLN